LNVKRLFQFQASDPVPAKTKIVHYESVYSSLRGAHFLIVHPFGFFMLLLEWNIMNTCCLKKKLPPVRPNSPPSPTTPMATSTPATRASTRTRTSPRPLQDYIHGAELDSDSLGLLPIPDYDQSDLRSLLNESSDYIQMRIQEQEGELRARNARDQAVIQKRLTKGPRNASPRED
jgi:hypothetical protein